MFTAAWSLLKGLAPYFGTPGALAQLGMTAAEELGLVNAGREIAKEAQGRVPQAEWDQVVAGLDAAEARFDAAAKPRPPGT